MRNSRAGTHSITEESLEILQFQPPRGWCDLLCLSPGWFCAPCGRNPWGRVLPGPSAVPGHCPCHGQALAAAVSALTVLVGALGQLGPGRTRRGKGQAEFQAALASASDPRGCQRKPQALRLICFYFTVVFKGLSCNCCLTP